MYFLVFSPSKHINPKNILDLLKIEFSGSNLESPVNSKERFIAKKIAKEIRSIYYVTLCQDVLAEVLLFGCRRQLKKVAQIGRRFCRIISLMDKPFIRLNVLRLIPRF